MDTKKRNKITIKETKTSEKESSVSQNPLLVRETTDLGENNGKSGFSSSFGELNKLSSALLAGDPDPGSPSLSSVAFKFKLKFTSFEGGVIVELPTDEQSDNPM